MKDVFPESLGQKHECAFYTGAQYTWQNTVYSKEKCIFKASVMGKKRKDILSPFITIAQ